MNIEIQQNMTEEDYYSHFYDYGDYPLDGFGICEASHVKEFGRIFLPVSYVIICFLSIIINILFIITLIKSKHQKTTFPINMAISDILFVLTLPFWAVYAHNEWTFGNNFCKTFSAIYMTTLYSSILFITCINIDRNLGRLWTISSKKYSPAIKRIVCFVVWSLSILAAAPHWTFVQEQEFHRQKVCSYHFGEKDHLLPWKIFIKIQLNIFGFLLPFLIMLLCYLQVCCTKTTVKVGESSKRPTVVMIVVFFMLWFPYNLVSLLHVLKHLHVISSCLTDIWLSFAIQATEVLAYSHGFINPIVYYFVNRRVWRYFVNMCRKRCRRVPDDYLDNCLENTDIMSVQSEGIELNEIQHQPEININ